MREIIIATANKGKFEEIKDILADDFDRYFSLNDFDEKIEVIEDGESYIENALKKARKIGDRFGMSTIADDSGLEVKSLGGRPGVYSARYGKDDDERIHRLLSELEGMPWERRTAIFKAYIAYYVPDKEISYIFPGTLKGYIGFEQKGDGGFGYDPIFYVPVLDKYVAELTKEEKNRISHRGRALQAFRDFIRTDFFYKYRLSASR